jgi:LPS sulfotransferase NodH
LIASSPRSGSQLLEELLTSTGLAGYPAEHFNPWHMGQATTNFPEDLLYGPEHIQKLTQKQTTPNGVFGTKAHFLQVVNFVGLDRLESLYPAPLKYISLRRRDSLRQGISLARAVQTNAYNSKMQPTSAPVYNFYQIMQCVREVCVDAKGWETYFQERGIEPFRVVYEDFVMTQRETVKGILEYLELEFPADFQITLHPQTKQADALSEQWVEKYQRGDRE